jgi:hypothetical protein
VDQFFAQYRQNERPVLVWLSLEKNKAKREIYIYMNEISE